MILQSKFRIDDVSVILYCTCCTCLVGSHPAMMCLQQQCQSGRASGLVGLTDIV